MSEEEISTTAAPPPVTNIYATCYGTPNTWSRDIRVSWNASIGATSYRVDRIEREAGSMGKLTKVYQGPETSYIDKGIPQNSVGVYYTVYAINSSGESQPENSPLPGVKIPCEVLPFQPGKPAKPSLVLVDDNTTRLSWNAPDPGDGSIKDYTVFDGSTTYNVGNVTSYNATRTKWGDSHQFQVRARNTYNATGEYSPYSDVVKLPGVPSEPVVSGIQVAEDGRQFAKFSWEEPDSEYPVTGYEVEYMVYTQGNGFAWTPSFDGVDSLPAEVLEYKIPIDEIPGRVEFYLRATSSIGVSDQATSVVNAYGSTPELPNFEGDYLGPDHVIDHLNKNNSSFSKLLNLSWLEANSIVEELWNNKDSVKPLFVGPDHVKKYDEYMYSTMADQYIDNATRDAILKINKILQKEDFDIFLDTPISYAPKEDIVSPDWDGPDHLRKCYDEICDYWNSTVLPEPPPIGPGDFEDWYALYLALCLEIAYEALCAAMSSSGFSCDCADTNDSCCDFWLAIYGYYAAALFIILALLPIILIGCVLVPEECPAFRGSGKSIVSRLIKNPGRFIHQEASAPSADTVNLFNEDNLESTWIRAANGVLTLEGRDSIDALSLTHAERFFEFLDIDWDGDWSTAVDLVKDNSNVLFTVEGYAAIRYALELPEFTDLDETLKTYRRMMERHGV